MAKKRQQLKLDSGSAFSKGRLRRLRQEDETWEADFRALPKPPYQNPTHYRGIVVTKKGEVLADSHVEDRPEASDLAALLTLAMQRPATGVAHRPSRLYVRGHHQWRELFPHLKYLGIKVSVRQELPKMQKAYKDYLRKMQEARRATMVRPTKEQQTVEELFPTIAKWVQGYGHIEIGDQEMFGFVARALDYGGMAFEDDRPETLAEAMAVLEQGLAEYIKRERIE